MKEFRTPGFGNTTNQSPLKARLIPLDDHYGISASRKETDTQVYVPDSTRRVRAFPVLSPLIPLEGQASGSGARISDECCAARLLPKSTHHTSTSCGQVTRDLPGGTSDRAVAGCRDPDDSRSHIHHPVILCTRGSTLCSPHSSVTL